MGPLLGLPTGTVAFIAFRLCDSQSATLARFDSEERMPLYTNAHSGTDDHGKTGEPCNQVDVNTHRSAGPLSL